MIKFKTDSSKENILKLIDLEIASLRNYLSIQQGLNRQILIFLKNFIGNLEIENDKNTEHDNKIYDYMSESDINLKKIKFNISKIDSLQITLNTLKSSNQDEESIKKSIVNYNDSYAQDMDKVFINTASIENFIHSISFVDLSEYVSIDDDKQNEITDEKKEDIQTPTSSCEIELNENLLLISEIQSKVLLPYTHKEINEILEQNPNDYSNKEDVIQKKFTKPLKFYRFSSISRFKEAYKLVIEREKGSKKSAISLAIELFSNYNLHPAIITACKNLNELDIYLSCLEYNELDDFHFFKIQYEYAPAIINLKTAFNFFEKEKQLNTVDECLQTSENSNSSEN